MQLKSRPIMPLLFLACAAALFPAAGTPGGMKDFPADSVMATVIAPDAEGRVIFGDETGNYRVRPHPDRFIPILEQGAPPQVPSPG